MDHCIVYTDGGGALSVLHPADNARLIEVDGQIMPAFAKFTHPSSMAKAVADGGAKYAETEQEFLARIAKKDVPAGAVDVVFVRCADLPADREFRDAWTLRSRAVAIDLAKAKNIVVERLRQVRAPLLQDLDVAFLRASEEANREKMEAVTQRKQYLRSVTKDVRLNAKGAKALSEAFAAICSEMASI